MLKNLIITCCVWIWVWFSPRLQSSLASMYVLIRLDVAYYEACQVNWLLWFRTIIYYVLGDHACWILDCLFAFLSFFLFVISDFISSYVHDDRCCQATGLKDDVKKIMHIYVLYCPFANVYYFILLHCLSVCIV